MRLRNKPWAEPFLEENEDLVLKAFESYPDAFKYIYNPNVEIEHIWKRKRKTRDRENIFGGHIHSHVWDDGRCCPFD